MNEFNGRSVAGEIPETLLSLNNSNVERTQGQFIWNVMRLVPKLMCSRLVAVFAAWEKRVVGLPA